jgi:hypothetical protein
VVSQCANPDCGAPFLYFRHGKLIALRHRGETAPAARVEFFWLCGECANHITLEVKLHGGMNLIPKTGSRAPA